MKEARLIVPVRGNNGEDLAETHVFVVERLIQHFHGFTVSPGAGQFINKDGEIVADEVRVYDVAGEDTPDNLRRLEAIARYVAFTADQESIYLRNFSGDVRLIQNYRPGLRAANDNRASERLDVV